MMTTVMQVYDVIFAIASDLQSLNNDFAIDTYTSKTFKHVMNYAKIVTQQKHHYGFFGNCFLNYIVLRKTSDKLDCLTVASYVIIGIVF